MNATHLYKGKPVEFLGRSYVWDGKQYCTILMVNATGKTQRQSIQERHLTLFAPDKSGAGSAAPAFTPTLSTTALEAEQ